MANVSKQTLVIRGCVLVKIVEKCSNIFAKSGESVSVFRFASLWKEIRKLKKEIDFISPSTRYGEFSP